MKKFIDKLDDPKFARKIHGWATIIWLAISIPTAILLKDSLAFVVWLSLYAIVVAHWSSWQASRTEVLQEKMNNGD